DAASASVFDTAGIDLLLVGDSIGNTMLGLPSTLAVTLEDMERATRAVATAVHRALIVADLPFGTYEASPAQAFASAARLMKAGAHAVKFEGGARVAPQVRLIAQSGVPVFGHLGFTPQSVHAMGGARIQGKDQADVDRLTADAERLVEAGVSAIVVELVPAGVAAALTAHLSVPIIGIGAGPDCDGQVLVWTDMAGLTAAPPRFVRTFGRAREELSAAATAYARAVRAGAYPDQDHSY
ncbi:MAG: 3-methyl-2-oxobutanoate hydroxymethyltransferase, partial [Bifidobacteriaceae bacterium]|nr:3-methyl-2-oxobutanoate hydroxymethyltransferase [Bifidobacteriaceae bacterium]